MILDEFEDEYKCKIRIRKHKKGFEINWNPSLNSEKEKGKGKTKGERQAPNQKGKRMAKNKVIPMKLNQDSSKNNSHHSSETDEKIDAEDITIGSNKGI